jgi:hypothetical protein
MKKILLTALFVLFASSSVHATASFPAFPMSVWGTLKDGQSDLPAGTVVKFFDASDSLLAQYSTGKDGQFGGVGALETIPTLQEFV